MAETKLKDIAEAAGVSVGTVSRALNGKTKGRWASSAVQVERILELAKEMNYQPNKAAQVMRTRMTHQIGVIGAEIHNPYTSRNIEIVNNELAHRGYGLLLKIIKGDKKEVISQLKDFTSNMIDGVMNHHPLIDGDELQTAVERIPSVTFDRSAEHSPAIVNMEGGVLIALQHLWNLGHRKIAIVTGGDEVGGRRRRISAYETFYSSQSQLAPENWRITTGWTYEAGEKAVKDFVDSGCTACLAGNDLLAVAICSGLRELGLEAPRDYSIVSIDDTILAKINRPQLTSIQPPIQELVTLSIDWLICKIEKRKPQSFQLLMPKLVVRQSSGPAPSR
ncbi:LacI family DNA-binding transcriptional regulator [Cerasicoccus maritimus]|uniref:LacI family DNA-binding transcriptional regulator n=1 Tax=Cerasicoccus maritimus TaxID=490089 RepID=UPI002852553C|nr:LacI family DNA-binding transcriptional regulator [Cerasicoccus maritimus]